MQQRLKKVDRLIKVQQHIHRSAELQLAALRRKEGELKVAQEDLLQTMGDTDALHGLFVDVIARRLKALSLEEARTQADIIAQKAVTTEKALRVKRSEKLHLRLRAEERHMQEKEDLAAILEAMTQARGTSLP